MTLLLCAMPAAAMKRRHRERGALVLTVAALAFCAAVTAADPARPATPEARATVTPDDQLPIIAGAIEKGDAFTAGALLTLLEDQFAQDRRVIALRQRLNVCIGPRQPLTATLADGVELQFVRIPAGNFVMGSATGRPEEITARVGGKAWTGRASLDSPPHRETLQESFLIGRYAVTQGQWKAAMGKLPGGCPDQGLTYPVTGATWEECRAFLRQLRTTRPGVFFNFPTEAQWEYACRAGTATEFYWGADPRRIAEFEWAGVVTDVAASGKAAMQPVGQKKANPWGLYDMLGNTPQWCRDVFEPYADSAAPDLKPDPPVRVVRGLACTLDANKWRCAYRTCNPPKTAGLRIVITLTDEPL